MNSRGFSLLETVMFIILAAVVIPIFFFTTQSVLKDMMTPTSYIKARFVAEKKMEQLMAYRFADSTIDAGNFGPSAVTTDTAFPAADYAGYQWQWAISYLDCAAGIGSCAGETGNTLLIVPNPPTYATNYKQIDVWVWGPQGIAYSYRATSAVTARY